MGAGGEGTYMVLLIHNHKQYWCIITLHLPVERFEGEAMLERTVHQRPAVANSPGGKRAVQLDNTTGK